MLKFFVNGVQQNIASSVKDAEVTLNALGSDWEGHASLIASVASDPLDALSDLQLPYTVSLTNLSATCINESGCKSSGFSWEDDVVFADGTPFLKGPFSASVTGSGDVDAFPFVSATVNGLNSFRASAGLNAGIYNFQTSGLIGNVSTAPFTNPGGIFGNLSAGNLSNAQGFVIKGSFALSPAAFNQTVTLPHSFELTMGAAPESTSPEPGTWWMASGCLLSTLVLFASRRRTRARRVR
ncbi:MAG TPA: hypothetical protein VHC72_14710 [Bryobacteraceae bacterium]|nr:hypothetical protein [Bryobacteraceae bacterium]